jgi:predicted ArsR family transcriptional regulator
MDRDELGDRVARVAALAEPVRRRLYRYVAAQSEPVSRDQACQGLGIPRHTAKFHLDKLVEEDLLVTSFKRLSDRSGPGAGRPTKLYRRSDRELSVSVPERRYDLAGQLMARAIEKSARDDVPVAEALHAAAAALGRSLGDQMRALLQRGRSRERLLDAAAQTLAAYGYEPAREGDQVKLLNCPFHLLAQEHTGLVCGMNLTMLESATAQVGEEKLAARLDPAPHRCCVLVTATEGRSPSRGP